MPTQLFIRRPALRTPVTPLRSGAKGLGLPTRISDSAPPYPEPRPCSSESAPPCLRPGDPYLRLCAPVSLTWRPVSLTLRPRVSGLETRISNLAAPYLRVGVPVSLVWRPVSLTLRRLSHALESRISDLPAHGLERCGGELGRAAARRFSRSAMNAGTYRHLSGRRPADERPPSRKANHRHVSVGSREAAEVIGIGHQDEATSKLDRRGDQMSICQMLRTGTSSRQDSTHDFGQRTIRVAHLDR